MKARPKSRQAKEAGDAAVIAVRVQPRASKNGICRMEDGSYKVRLTAPPVDGAANEALVGYLSQVLKVGKSSVGIVSGHTSREKRVKIVGMNGSDVTRLLNIDKQ